jgi:threonine/homoserine/homoserine lactone efflux protein
MTGLLPIAHAGHWLVNIAYLAPVVGFLGWLSWTAFRERREKRREEAANG